MKLQYLTYGKLRLFIGGIFVASAISLFSACKETIDASNFAIASEPTVYDYLNNDERFSDIVSVFERVNLVEIPEGSSFTSSSIANTLQTRGNYTCFIPTNEAVEAYVSRLTGGRSTNVADLTYEQAESMAKNCLIDNGNNSAYESPDFPTSGSFAVSNMNDRILTCEEISTDDSGASVEPYYLINGEARIIQSDIEVSNGLIHVVDCVIAPSSNTVPDMIRAADNMHIFSKLLTLTGWDAKMMDYRDAAYEEQELSETETLANVGTFSVQQRRYLGYTAFVETDDVYESEWGCPAPDYDETTGEILNWDEIEPIVMREAAAIYPQENENVEVTSEDHPLNRFVAYHILEGRIAYDRFVHHLNEYNYRYIDIVNPVQRDYTVDVWDYYTTVGSHRGLMKVLQSAGESGYPMYINRVCRYNDDNYRQESIINPGVQILATNGANDNNALNGFYYPIKSILSYDDNVRLQLANERIRIDATTMLPEMSSNNLRGGTYMAFPTGFFSNIMNESSGTRIFYLNVAYSQKGNLWKDAQGDEFIFAGVFDFILKLPPVPRDGTYEVRMALSNNSLRGMAQIYFGDDPNNLIPAGLPVDMRQGQSDNPSIPWVADTDDDVVNSENDKNLRNQGYMKGPKYYMMCNGAGYTGGDDICIRNYTGMDVVALRRIITTQEMKADKTYYLRFKSALDQRDAQFWIDYFELVNSSVYNGTEPEDIW